MAGDKYRSPGVFCVQFVTEAEDRLDFLSQDARSLDDAFGIAREAIATHPDFVYEAVVIWKDRSSEDMRRISMEEPPPS